MNAAKEWQGITKLSDGKWSGHDGPKITGTKVSLKIKEDKKKFEVEALGVSNKEANTFIEGNYLCIRQKKSGFGKFLPNKGKLLKQVYLPEDVMLPKSLPNSKSKNIKIQFLKRNQKDS